MDRCGRLHLKGAPFLVGHVLIKQNSTKDEERFPYLQRMLLLIIRMNIVAMEDDKLILKMPSYHLVLQNIRNIPVMKKECFLGIHSTGCLMIHALEFNKTKE